MSGREDKRSNDTKTHQSESNEDIVAAESFFDDDACVESKADGEHDEGKEDRDDKHKGIAVSDWVEVVWRRESDENLRWDLTHVGDMLVRCSSC